MRQVNVAMALIKQGDVYLLQHRDGDPKIGAAGLIGCFGGKIGEDESALLAICRELSEETTIVADKKRFHKIGQVEVESDHQLEPVSIVAQVFGIIIEPDIAVEAQEGKLIKMTKKEAIKSIDKLTPATRVCFLELV